MNIKLLQWSLVLIWCIGIFLFTASPISQPENTRQFIESGLSEDNDLKHTDNKDNTTAISEKSNTKMLNFLMRKSGHFLGFGTLAVLFWFGLSATGWWRYLLAWGFATIYGATDEWHQSFIPGRSASVYDVMLDSAGALVFLLVLYLCLCIRFKTSKTALQ